MPYMVSYRTFFIPAPQIYDHMKKTPCDMTYKAIKANYYETLRHTHE